MQTLALAALVLTGLADTPAPADASPATSSREETLWIAGGVALGAALVGAAAGALLAGAAASVKGHTAPPGGDQPPPTNPTSGKARLVLP